MAEKPPADAGVKPLGFWPALIRELRIAADLSQRQLADMARVPRHTLRKIEKGAARGEIDTIEALLDVFGYDLDACDRRSKTNPRAGSDPQQYRATPGAPHT